MITFWSTIRFSLLDMIRINIKQFGFGFFELYELLPVFFKPSGAEERHTGVFYKACVSQSNYYVLFILIKYLVLVETSCTFVI